MYPTLDPKLRMEYIRPPRRAFLSFPALYLALENVTGKIVEALRALVTSDVSKYVCGGSLGL